MQSRHTLAGSLLIAATALGGFICYYLCTRNVQVSTCKNLDAINIQRRSHLVEDHLRQLKDREKYLADQVTTDMLVGGEVIQVTGSQFSKDRLKPAIVLHDRNVQLNTAQINALQSKNERLKAQMSHQRNLNAINLNNITAAKAATNAQQSGIDDASLQHAKRVSLAAKQQNTLLTRITIQHQKNHEETAKAFSKGISTTVASHIQGDANISAIDKGLVVNGPTGTTVVEAGN